MGAKHLTTPELEAGLDEIRQSPSDNGVLAMIVRRPQSGQREILREGQLDEEEGLVSDNWLARGSGQTPDGRAHPEMQLTLMNSRAIALLAQQPDRWPLAGDQLFVDMDLSVRNLPCGARLAIGAAVIEITAEPHTGCKQFAARYGPDAVRFVNSTVGKQLRLRGLNAKVERGGGVRTGDVVKKLDA